MSRVRCLYCDVENDAVQSAGFCENCGKKLPPASLAHQHREPALRERMESGLPEIDRTPADPASAWLVTAAIVNLLGCGILVVAAPLLLPREQVKAEFIPDLLLVSVAVLLSFGVLAWWARVRPVPALAAAAIIYVALSVVDALLAPVLALLALPVKIVILVLLIQAFRLGRKPHRLIV